MSIIIQPQKWANGKFNSDPKNQICRPVRVSDGKNFQWAITSVTTKNSAPIVNSQSRPAIIHTDDDLVVNYQFSDLDNSDVINPSIAWTKNGIQQTIFDGYRLPASATMKAIFGLQLFPVMMEKFSLQSA